MKKYLLSELTSGSDYNLMKASLLQKLIRRGMTREALYIGTIFLKQGHEKGLRRRLQIIAAEDIGLGWPESLNYIEKNEFLQCLRRAALLTSTEAPAAKLHGST